MATAGAESHVPALKATTLKTLFLRVPGDDWLAVKYGRKAEFRTTRAEKTLLVSSVRLPTPVVAYSDEHEGYRLMVLGEHRFEPLFNVSLNHGSAERAGFPSYDHFRRDWRARHGGEYHPMEQVHVWCVRPWGKHDFVNMGYRLLGWLYGDYIDF